MINLVNQFNIHRSSFTMIYMAMAYILIAIMFCYHLNFALGPLQVMVRNTVTRNIVTRNIVTKRMRKTKTKEGLWGT